MAKKFKQFPAKAIVLSTSVTSAFLLDAYIKDTGASDLLEIDVKDMPGIFTCFLVTITEDWYNKHKKHSNINIYNYEDKLEWYNKQKQNK